MLIKYLRLIVAFANAFQILWFKFPRASREKKLALIQTWSSDFLKLLGIRLCVMPFHEHRQASTVNLVVCNHVSWLDVLVIQAIRPSVFVAKLEVQRWPMIGHLATACGVIFVDRGSTQSAHKMVDDVAAALHHGYTVAGFPEGTSSEGHMVQVFHANLFEAAIKSDSRVLPMALRYTHAHTAALCREAAFVGELGFLASMHQVIKAGPIDVRVKLGPALTPQGHSRRTLAHLSHQHVAMQLETL
jgi:1-acyl-sn-glycerol-3-phosphate acyltransferase